MYFINVTELDLIIQTYRNLINRTSWHLTENSTPCFFYLSFANKTFGNCATKYDLVPIPPQGYLSQNPFYIAKNILFAFTGMSRRQLSVTYNLSDLEQREIGVKIVRSIQSGEIQSESQLKRYILSDFDIKPATIPGTTMKSELTQLQNYFVSTTNNKGNHQYSSIHKAKGLEADGVLALAQTENQLNSWFATDKNIRHNDKIDQCRIGYVAFSRAKQVLCIACCQEISDSLLQLAIRQI